MFDPLFALAFLLVVTVPIAAVVILAARKYLRLASVLWVALAVPLGGLIGFFVSMKLNYELDPVRFLNETPMTRFGILLMSGIVLAGLIGLLAWHTLPKKNPESSRPME